ncbi:MAG: ribosome-associated translation inhibitor RaiA [Clostridia bacterium]|nr:ribosome-associated translation inhibitor RaiA [Clostridia bacterium]
MKLTLITKGFKPVDEYANLEQITEKKYSKLDRYFKDETDITLVIKYEHDIYKAEITIPYGGFVFRVEEASDDAYTAANVALDKMERQIIKQKSVYRNKFYGDDFRNFPVSDEFDEVDNVESNVVKHKTYTTKPMLVDEAILQMELTDRDFYVFMNGSTFEINVIYKRKDGKYGLIEPD